MWLQGLCEAVGVSNYNAQRTRHAATRLKNAGVQLATNQVSTHSGLKISIAQLLRPVIGLGCCLCKIVFPGLCFCLRQPCLDLHVQGPSSVAQKNHSGSIHWVLEIMYLVPMKKWPCWRRPWVCKAALLGCATQVMYSLLYRAPEQNGLWEACKENNVRPIAYSPLGLGLLTGRKDCRMAVCSMSQRERAFPLFDP